MADGRNIEEVSSLTKTDLTPASNPIESLTTTISQGPAVHERPVHPAIARIEALKQGHDVLFEDVKNNPKVQLLVKMADKHLEALGYTEHGLRHNGIVSTRAMKLMRTLGYNERVCHLTAIAGYTHDVGNIVSRHQHGISSALMMWDILKDMDMPLEEIALVIGAIGNHEEQYGDPLHPVGAGAVIADKSDVHYTRVRHRNTITDDIHDRVNLACRRSYLTSEAAGRTITLELEIDTTISPLMEYFRIFASRMDMCYRAAKILEATFQLRINGQNFYGS